ncbi:sulfate ABC transporter substrate-binding protein [Novosphingobium profundi]|uniref:sulfate ABC transporter substrate-binding protein n=1 Tax=Novosphingobium profundi TaxID=1774954 RepID=UPI001BDA3731|nr:sulfate ABC transporter substrate-binding protein [Novosphingobium profundi]MBT0670158.1 sulfate ABC transporter substrate-binding protein [Novosphingobium profundi]
MFLTRKVRAPGAAAAPARLLLTSLALASLALAGCSGKTRDADAQSIELLNVSYDPTRELYEELNPRFAAKWKAQSGQDVKITMSHGGSGKQARAVIDGLDADVVTLALGYDIDAIAQKSGGKLDAQWQKRLPHNSTPYASTIVFLVRKGNPKGIHDWGDLVKPGVAVITPNPKTSGGARWNFLAAWAYGKTHGDGSDAAAQDYVKRLYANVPVLDSGARGATTTFVERGIGDVLLAWENEAFLAQKELGEGKFDVIAPSISILAEPPVALVDGNARRHGTTKAAKAYLDFLYTPEAQEIIARNHYRPVDPEVAKKYASTFPTLTLVTIDHDFGGWKAAQERFFSDGGVFDKIYTQAGR